MDPKNFSQLRWACRRGMLELDVLLGNYLEEAYPQLSDRDKAEFVRLLDFNDQELFDWLTKKAIPHDSSVAITVEKVRLHAKNRH